LAKHVHQAGIKVVLTGEGADEIFLGYDIFKEAWFIEHYDQFRDDEERIIVLSKLYPYLPHFNQRESKVLLSFYKRYAAQRNVFSPGHLSRIANGSLAAGLFGDQSEDGDIMSQLEQAVMNVTPQAAEYSPVMKCAATERLTLMHGYLLSSQGDRMSSAHSLEGRHAFLDPHVTALADRLPESMKLKGGFEEKWILKQAFAKQIPSTITSRPKQPYRAPGSVCLLRGEGDWLDCLLSDDRLKRSSAIEMQTATRIIEQIHRTPQDHISPKLDMAYITLITTLLLEDYTKGLANQTYPAIDHKIKVAINGLDK
jgi:asparagine synthase (glutamine-hydrolysing)